jgi:hypothetical protein
MFSFGLFPGICHLNANVSEHSVCSEMLAFKLQKNPKENMTNHDLSVDRWFLT